MAHAHETVCEFECVFVLLLVCECVPCMSNSNDVGPLKNFQRDVSLFNKITMPNITSYHIISYHIISYHIISYHIISYHIISYHIISYIKSYHILNGFQRDVSLFNTTTMRISHPYRFFFCVTTHPTHRLPI